MWKKILDFFFGLFTRTPTVTNADGELVSRSREEANDLAAESLLSLGRYETGKISCPWHMDRGSSLIFNKPTNSFHCDVCDRSGSISTLANRLHAVDVYREAVE